MLTAALLLLAAAPPGPAPEPEVPPLHLPAPSPHALAHAEHRGSVCLSVSGEDLGAELTATVFGFLPYWVGDVRLRYDLLSVLACFCVDMGASGEITGWNGYPGSFQAAMDSVSAAGGTPVVTVVSFSGTAIHSILTTNRETAISTMVGLVVGTPAEGVCIDFENVDPADREALVSFTCDLRDELDAVAPGSHLSVCTPAVDWGDAFDYAALAGPCDALFIMCYAFSGSWSGVAGPNCPLVGWGYSQESPSNMSWTMGDYARNAPEAHGRLVLGVPYYGHEWETEGSGTHSPVSGSCATLTYEALAGRAETHGRLWDAESLTPWYRYYSGGWHQGWYDDVESLGLKYDMVRQAGLQGMGIWALGYDGGRPELWELIEEDFAGEVWEDDTLDNLESGCVVGGPARYWRVVAGSGVRRGHFYTYSISSPPDVSWIEWRLPGPDHGQVELEAYLPEGGEATVTYVVSTAGGALDSVEVDQSRHQGEWVPLGGPYGASGRIVVRAGDCTGSTGERIVADAVRWSGTTGCGERGVQAEAPAPEVLGSPGPSPALLVPASSLRRSVGLYDASGRRVGEWELPAGGDLLLLPCEGLPAGVYVAAVRSDGAARGAMMVLLR